MQGPCRLFEVKSPNSSRERSGLSRLDYLCIIILLCFAAVMVAHNVTVGELHFNLDETVHALDGQFMANLLRDLPLRHPAEYTFTYYAHYPGLGIVHWPPLFPFAESLIFLFFGSSVVVARLVVLAFALLLVVFWYRLARYVAGSFAAAISSVFLICMPATLLFSKLVMTEVPCMSLCVAASFYWLRYLDEQRMVDACCFALCSSLALLTKQNAIYLPAFCIFTAIGLRRFKLLLSKKAWVAVGIVAGLTAPYYILALIVQWRTFAVDVFEAQKSSSQSLLMYLHVVPEQTGWLLLMLAGLGASIAVARAEKRRVAVVALAWIIACYVTMTAIGHKEPRYVVYWVPAFALLAAIPFEIAIRQPRLRWAQSAAIILVLALLIPPAWSYQRPYVIGYQQACDEVLLRMRSGVLLVDDPEGWPSTIFYIQPKDPQRQIVVMRKALYVLRWKKEGGYTELVNNPEDAQRIIDTNAIRYVLINEGVDLEFKSELVFREYLRSGRFRVAARIPIISNDPERQNRLLLLYENLSPTIPNNHELRIPMMTISHDIVIRVD